MPSKMKISMGNQCIVDALRCRCYLSVICVLLSLGSPTCVEQFCKGNLSGDRCIFEKEILVVINVKHCYGERRRSKSTTFY